VIARSHRRGGGDLVRQGPNSMRPTPLLPLGFLRRPQFVDANVIWLLAAMTCWGAVFFLAVNLQVGLGGCDPSPPGCCSPRSTW